jgi:methyl-accepting chemotaxis protein
MSLRYKLLIPLLSLVLGFGVVLLLIVNWNMQNNYDEQQETLFNAKINDLTMSQNRVQRKALSHAAIYSKMPAVINAYQIALNGNIDDPLDAEAAKARALLRDQLKPNLQGFSSIITDGKYKIHFHLPNGRSLLRLWRKTQSLNGLDESDDISSFRKTVIDINKGNHEPIQGIEIGRGGFAVRGLAPISTNNGEHLGSVEMLYSFKDITRFSKSNDQQNFAVYMNKEFLYIAKSLNKPAEHPILDNKYVLVNATDPHLTKRYVTGEVLDHGRIKRSELFAEDNITFASFPINDYKGHQIGIMVFFVDNTTAIEAIANNRRIIIFSIFICIAALTVILFTTVSGILKPILFLRDKAASLAVGNIEDDIHIERNDELGELTGSIKALIQSQQERAELAKQISNGNIEMEIKMLSEEDILSAAMGEMKTSIQSMIDTLQHTTKQQIQGDLDARCDTDVVKGAFKEILEGVNNTLDAVIQPLNEGITLLSEYAKGNLEKTMRDLPGKQMILTSGLNEIQNNLNALVEEGLRLSSEIQSGKLNERGKTNAFSGRYLDILHGFNATLDAVIEPFNTTSDYISQLAKGKIPKQLAKNYEGDFERVKKNLNNCIAAIEGLVTDTHTLINKAVEGNLTGRANAERHNGEYKNIILGINSILDEAVNPIVEAKKILEQVAKGNLREMVHGNYHGDHADIKEALNLTIHSLNNALNEVQVMTDQISSGANQVANSSTAVSQGAAEQASSLEEISSTMDEIYSKSKTTTEKSSMATTLSSTTQKAAESGNSEMDRMLSAMKDINQSSDQIAKIIKAIDDIAFQTNLLALNAAVEAARAGVHGKGFAVVAEEVRNLAQRSAKAANETKELIEESIQKINNGTQIAETTSTQFSDIITSITKVNDIILEINADSEDQLTSINEINSALSQINTVTQSNTASAEESASASEELSNQSNSLVEIINRFKLQKKMKKSAPKISKKESAKIKERKQYPIAEQPSNVNHPQASLEAALIPSDIINLDDDDFGDF